MGQCIYCGQECPEGTIAHPTCEQEYRAKHIAGAAPAAAPVVASPAEQPREDMTVGQLGLHVFGWPSFLIGLFLLVVSPNIKPTTSTYSIEPVPEVVNLHKMFLGSTLTITGAIFLAAVWRPRK